MVFPGDDAQSLGTVNGDNVVGNNGEEVVVADEADDDDEDYDDSEEEDVSYDEEDLSDDDVLYVVNETNPVLPRKRFASAGDGDPNSIRGSYRLTNDTAARVSTVRVYRGTPDGPAREMAHVLTQNAAGLSPGAATATALLGYTGGMRTDTIPVALFGALPDGVIQRGGTDVKSPAPSVLAGVQYDSFMRYCRARGLNEEDQAPWWEAYAGWHQQQLDARNARRRRNGQPDLVYWEGPGDFYEIVEPGLLQRVVNAIRELFGW